MDSCPRATQQGGGPVPWPSPTFRGESGPPPRAGSLGNTTTGKRAGGDKKGGIQACEGPTSGAGSQGRKSSETRLSSLVPEMDPLTGKQLPALCHTECVRTPLV